MVLTYSQNVMRQSTASLPTFMSTPKPQGREIAPYKRGNNMSDSNSGSIGIGMGTVIAILLSWTVNKSIIWCIIHGFFSWFYIIYHVVKYY